jgi:dolichyl-phosphate-mannose-protein mannosyltransferase
MSGDAGLKQRGGPKKKASHQDLNSANLSAPSPGKVIVRAKEQVKDVAEKAGSQWDYKLALAILTVLGFLTRFYGITHPNSVVFDEVHFGKVRVLYCNCHMNRIWKAET